MCSNTIVTPFITNINQISFRNNETYIAYGKKILQTNIPVLCFLERQVYETFFAQELHLFPQTNFVMFEKTENYLYSHLHEITEFNIHTNNPTKDTIEYMFLQCHKTEFLRQAIKLNPFQTTNYTWVDFGIFHMIREEEQMRQELIRMSQSVYDKVRIASCIDPHLPNSTDIYKNVVWYFAGSVVGGHSETILDFANAMKEKCISIIREKKHIMWEINIWYLLFQTHSHLFEPYRADHNISILKNY